MINLLLRCLVALGLCLLGSNACAGGVPSDCSQLIVGIAPSWDSMRGELQRFERDGTGPWRAVSPAIPVLFGKHGLAWGSGVEGQHESGLRKAERDGRAPAGIFRIGKIYTYDTQLPPGANYPFHTVTKADAWIDDVSLPDYNRMITIPDSAHPPAWFEKQKMRHNDFAYRWLVDIRHNSDPPVPGQGSAIFFHIRRGENRPSAGCTTMAEANLVKLITWLRSDRHPCYALLPDEAYQAKADAWHLPKEVTKK